MIKTNIKMRVTPEQSRRVQEICFENGIVWPQSKDTVKLVERPFLYIYEDSISTCDSEYHFNKSKPKPIDAGLFIRTNGAYEEDSFDIKLNKIENSCDNVLKILESIDNKKYKEKDLYSENLKDIKNILDDLNKTIDLLEDRIKEKETIISYLESKLK